MDVLEGLHTLACTVHSDVTTARAAVLAWNRCSLAGGSVDELSAIRELCVRRPCRHSSAS